jgi:hypothetical protein
MPSRTNKIFEFFFLNISEKIVPDPMSKNIYSKPTLVFFGIFFSLSLGALRRPRMAFRLKEADPLSYVANPRYKLGGVASSFSAGAAVVSPL